MSHNIFIISLLALVLIGAAAAQSEESLIENDNNSPDDHLDTPDDADEVAEGSGKGTTDETVSFLSSLEFDTTTAAIPLEDVEATATTEEDPTTLNPDKHCPKPCLCSIEDNDFVTDCSGHGLTEIPSPLNPETTILRINNNQLTEIPKDISSLRNLTILKADNNSIMEVTAGSISELPKLKVLKLANNRLLEMPLDLKNSFQLTQLEELDLGGNDIRTEVTPDLLANFESLWKLTIPTSSDELLQDLCRKTKNLYTICTGSCDIQTYDCSEPLSTTEVDLIHATVPGAIPLLDEDSDTDPTLNNLDTNTATEETETEIETKADASEELLPVNISPSNAIVSKDTPSDELSQTSRSGGQKEINASIIDDETENHKDANKTESNVKVGATTESNPGGIDKSVIGFVVAAMVVIIAGITIGKNWSSIMRRFRSNSRTPERGAGGANANGASPEQVPLKEKSPV